jgi:curved DNA-binding protein CbpA
MEDGAPRRQPYKSHYDVLQVSPHACPEVIHAAYRALARAYHPDLNHGAQAAQQMRELNDAYDVLQDAERRATYDAERLRMARAAARRTTPRIRGAAGAPPAAGPRRGTPIRPARFKAVALGAEDSVTAAAPAPPTVLGMPGMPAASGAPAAALLGSHRSGHATPAVVRAAAAALLILAITMVLMAACSVARELFEERPPGVVGTVGVIDAREVGRR